MPRRLMVRLRILIPSIEVRILAGHPGFPKFSDRSLRQLFRHNRTRVSWVGQTVERVRLTGYIL